MVEPRELPPARWLSRGSRRNHRRRPASADRAPSLSSFTSPQLTAKDWRCDPSWSWADPDPEFPPIRVVTWPDVFGDPHSDPPPSAGSVDLASGTAPTTEASENRVWFVMLPAFAEVPVRWAREAGRRAADFGVGWRAMARWRSGPMFLEPALAGFDYAMTLDTDSYFPGDWAEDPFDLLQREGLVAAFPHLGRDSASVLANFDQHVLIYARLHGLGVRHRGAPISQDIEQQAPQIGQPGYTTSPEFLSVGEKN